MIKPLLTTALAVALTYLIKMYTIKITCNESLDHAWCYVEWRNEVWKKVWTCFLRSDCYLTIMYGTFESQLNYFAGQMKITIELCTWAQKVSLPMSL